MGYENGTSKHREEIANESLRCLLWIVFDDKVVLFCRMLISVLDHGSG
jgi:hypothetical protein